MTQWVHAVQAEREAMENKEYSVLRATEEGETRYLPGITWYHLSHRRK